MHYREYIPVPVRSLVPLLVCERFRILLVLFLLSIATIASAQQAIEPHPVKPWQAPHFSIDPKSLYEAASVVAAPDNADVAVLEDDESYSFDEAGRSVHVEYVVYKILNQKGVEAWDSVSVDWEPWHEARPIIQARVIARDLSVHMLDPKSITEAPAREGSYKTYSDGKMLRAPFPAIAPGVVVEEEFITRETDPFFAPGHVGEIIFGREAVPVAHSLAVLEAPASLPLKTETRLLPGLKPQRTEAHGRVTLTFEQGSLDAFEAIDSHLPSDLPHLPAVLFSTGASWQAMATEYGKIVDSRANTADVESMVHHQLIADKSSVAQKEAAILSYLDREVRYTGIEFGEAAIVPHTPAETVVRFEAVHLDEQLVQGLLAFIVSAAQASATVAAHSINLVDEDDAGRVLLALFKQVAHNGLAPTPTNISTKSEPEMEKKGMFASCNRAGEQRFTGSRRPYEQHALRNAPTEFLEFCGSRRYSMISFSSSLASSTPATSLNVTFFCCIESKRARLLPKLSALFPPDCICRSMKNQTAMETRTARR